MTPPEEGAEGEVTYTLDRMLAAIVMRQRDLREELNDLHRDLNRVTELLHGASVTAHSREKLHRRIRRIEKMLNIGSETDDEPGSL